MVLYIGIYIIVWLICSVICMGLAFAYMQGAYSFIANTDKKSDISFSRYWGLFTGLLLLLGVVIAYILSENGKYGWRLR